MILREKLLLEEDNFEDEVVDSAGIDEVNAGDTFEGDMEDNIPTEETPVTDEISAPMTTYKVSFNLGSHSNWSRVEASSEEDAKQIVQDYITNKWPNRKYEFVDIEEFVEEDVQESLNEDMIIGYSETAIKSMIEILESNIEDYKQLIIDEPDYKDEWEKEIETCQKKLDEIKSYKPINESVTDAQPFETESAIGMSMVISDLIKDEYEAIDGYNSAIATAEAEGWGGLVKILTDIQAEEHIHIGQLQELLKSTDPNADKIIDGHLEAIYQQADVEPELSV